MMPIRPLMMRKAASTGKTPDQVSGLTLWIDFSDSAYTYTNTACTTHVASNGDNIRGLVNKAGIGSNFTYGGTRATWVTNSQNGKAVGKCNDVGGFSGSNFSTYASNTDFLIIAVVKLHGITTTNNTYLGYGLVTNGFGSGSYCGMNFSNASSGTAFVYNWDGNADYATTSLAQDVYAVIAVQHKSGNVRVSINGGSWTTTASGNTSLLSNATYIAGGVNTGSGGEAHIGELSIHSGTVSDADYADLIAGYRNRWAI